MPKQSDRWPHDVGNKTFHIGITHIKIVRFFAPAGEPVKTFLALKTPSNC
jgi:hypothetical protein